MSKARRFTYGGTLADNLSQRAKAWYDMKAWLDANPSLAAHFDMHEFMRQKPVPVDYGVDWAGEAGSVTSEQWRFLYEQQWPPEPEGQVELVMGKDGVYRPKK